ncbi:Methyl farnesoate epoxidase [Amphibalanus amphitrite]|uniref:Methyl farnesoate epoxidase n=1 Tax=Amphibalanus amphitrite TaxID=1232801 RepID=A0A6A4V8B9_AMPAM|nr:Methyl farnesoate epoxidase [Amphibalanus amphitrite]
MELLIRTEVNELVTELADAREPVPVKSLFRWRYFNLSWTIVTGQRLPAAEAQRLAHLFTLEMSALQNTWVNNSVLRTIFPEKSGFADVLRYRDAVRAAFAAAVRGGGGTFVAKVRAAQPEPAAWRPEVDEDLVMFFFDFMNGGCETTSSFFEWSMAYLLREPELQRRLRKEVAALPSQPTLAHRANAPLLRAFETEVFRRSSLTPAGVPHRSLQNFKVGGYNVPAGTTLRYDIMGAHWDPARWSDPLRFRPERFLRNGKFMGSEDVVPYGIGLRRCTGEKYAEAYHFMLLASLLREVTVEPAPGAALPTEAASIGLVRLCLPFDVVCRRAPPPQ